MPLPLKKEKRICNFRLLIKKVKPFNFKVLIKPKYTYPNGEIYEGEWREDQREGYGVFTAVDESVY